MIEPVDKGVDAVEKDIAEMDPTTETTQPPITCYSVGVYYICCFEGELDSCWDTTWRRSDTSDSMSDIDSNVHTSVGAVTPAFGNPNAQDGNGELEDPKYRDTPTEEVCEQKPHMESGVDER